MDHLDPQLTLDLAHPGPDEAHDAEAALEALRAAIGHPIDDFAVQPEAESSAATHQLSSAQWQTLEKALAALSQLSSNSQTIMDSLNLSAMITGLVGSLQLLVESNTRQKEIVRALVGQLAGQGNIPVDAALIGLSYVPRSEFDALKQKYDALAAQSTTSKRARASKPAIGFADDEGDSRAASEMPQGADRPGSRRKRSMKLEHLVHQMANRRLGVEYPVAQFSSAGRRDLPDPSSAPLSAGQAPNRVQELRPDFRTANESAASVKPFLDQVLEDCIAAWQGGVGQGEEDFSKTQIKTAVAVYWTRLCKRWDEQQTKQRGEVHRDELTRRKQNQYRRQQSLVARRLAAFDQSPLNVCRLRALYRTLLTVDFAAPTLEKPDPKRSYTEEEWYAYQKLTGGARAVEAQEIVDQFWLSASARSLLQILDAFSSDQSGRIKRKGRPKQPVPGFHLPRELWDQTTLPPLRPKTPDGLPVSGASGAVLFRFHVDDAVAADHPDWAAGLYDNPPIPEEDGMLPVLADVMGVSIYAHILPRTKAERDRAEVARLTPAELTEVSARPWPDANEELDTEPLPTDGLTGAQSLTSAANLESLLSSISNSFILNNPLAGLPGSGGGAGTGLGSGMGTSGGLGSLGPATGVGAGMSLHMGVASEGPGSQIGPGAGSSSRARRQTKKSAREAPGGAAMPVAKKRKVEGEGETLGEIGAGNGGGEGEGVEGELEGDGQFLEGM